MQSTPLKATYDSIVDALYIYCSKTAVARTEQITPGVYCDFNDQGEIVGFEFLNLAVQKTMRSSTLWSVIPLDSSNQPIGKPRLCARASKAWRLAASLTPCLVERSYYGSVKSLRRKAYKAWIVTEMKP